MKTEQIPPIFRIKTIYYIIPFLYIGILSLMEFNIGFNDLGTCLKIGEVMIEKGAIVSQDIFTHTFDGLKYINSGWLSQVLMALCEKAGGLNSLLLLRTILLFLYVGILYHLINNQTKKNYKITFIFMLFAFITGIYIWQIRPQLFAIPLFVFFYSQILQKKEIRNSSILLLSLLMILWVNLHSSFPLGIMLSGIFLLGDAGEKYYRKRDIKKLIRDPYLKRLILLLIILTSVTLINPYGINIWKDVWGNSSVSVTRSSEWLPTKMNNFSGYSLIVSVVLAGIILKYSKRKITFTEALLLLSFLFAGFKAVRMILWWGIVSAPILATHFCSIEVVQKKISRQKNGVSPESECLPLNILFLIFIVLVFVSLLPWLRPYHPIKSMRVFLKSQIEPEAITYYIKKQDLKGNMFNNIHWGSYIVWKLWPEHKIFADNRLHIIPEKIWKDYTDVHFGLANWPNILDRYKISFVVLSKEDNKRTIEFIRAHPAWKKVYEDKMGAIFVRK